MSVSQMLSVTSVLVFAIVLFFYLHIQFHLKTSNDLEVYELDTPSKATLEEVCDLRQPACLSFAPDQLVRRLGAAADTYGAFDVKVRDSKAAVDEDEDPYVPLRLDQAAAVMASDKESRYFIEGNADFLSETGLEKVFRADDPFLRPHLVASCRYDYVAGSQGTRTPLRYELSNRTYFVVVTGRVKMKLAPPKTTRYLYPVSDYCNYEFRSPIDPWSPQPQYQGDFDKVKCLDVVLQPGSAFYLPAKWWYSMEFVDPGTKVAVCRYSTYMSALASSPHSLLWALQTQNVQHRIAAQLAPNTTAAAPETPHQRNSHPTVPNEPLRPSGASRSAPESVGRGHPRSEPQRRQLRQRGPTGSSLGGTQDAETRPEADPKVLPAATVATSTVPVSAVAA